MGDFLKHKTCALERDPLSRLCTRLKFPLALVVVSLAASCASSASPKPQSVPTATNAARSSAPISSEPASEAGSKMSPDAGKTPLKFESLSELMRAKLEAGAEVDLRGVVTI